MAPIPRHQKQIKNAKRSSGKKTGNSGIDIDSAVESIVNEKLKDLLGECSHPASPRGKRLASERQDDSESEVEDFPPPKHSKQTKTPKKSFPQKTEYASQVVILEGIDDALKKHPTRLSEAFSKAKPNVELKPDGLRMTASGETKESQRL